jgi:hypothetical protein
LNIFLLGRASNTCVDFKCHKSLPDAARVILLLWSRATYGGRT